MTTPLWILPYVLCGLVVGVYARRHDFQLSQWQIVFIVVLAELMVTGINTVALIVDAKIFGYYTPTLITGALLLRLVLCVGKALAYAFVLPPLLTQLRKREKKA